MPNRPLTLAAGQRVTYRGDSNMTGTVLEHHLTLKGRQIARVLFDGEDAPRMFDAAVLIAA